MSDKIRCCKMVALFPPWQPSRSPSPHEPDRRSVYEAYSEMGRPHSVTAMRKGETNSPHNYHDWTECVTRLVNGERTVHPGSNISLDLHLVWNRAEYCDEEEEEKCRKFIYSFNGKNTKTGKIYVTEKENWGHGFEVIGEVGRDYYNDYEYWCYQEDDHYIIPTGKGYFAQAIKQLKENDKLKCVAFSPIMPGEELPLALKFAHFGGAYGVWHRSCMDMKTFPFTQIGVRNIPFYAGEGSMCAWLLNSFEHYSETEYEDHVICGEAAFTEIRNYSNAPENWVDLQTYKVCLKDPKTKMTIEEPFIFKVGLSGNGAPFPQDLGRLYGRK